MADTNTLIEAVLHFKSDDGRGFSETHFLPQTTLASALVNLTEMAAWAINARCPGLQLVYGRCSFVDTPRYTVAVDGLPGKPRVYKGVQETPINTIETALQYRFETADGDWSNVLLRGIGDDLIVAGTPVIGTSGLDPNVSYEGVDIANPDQYHIRIFKAYLDYLKKNTLYVKKNHPPAAFTFTTKPWNRCLFRKVANRQTGTWFGAPRGRASKT